MPFGLNGKTGEAEISSKRASFRRKSLRYNEITLFCPKAKNSPILHPKAGSPANTRFWRVKKRFVRAFRAATAIRALGTNRKSPQVFASENSRKLAVDYGQKA